MLLQSLKQAEEKRDEQDELYRRLADELVAEQLKCAGIEKLEEEIASLSTQIANLSSLISSLSNKINACNSTQASLQASMNSYAYDMNHYKKYTY